MGIPLRRIARGLFLALPLAGLLIARVAFAAEDWSITDFKSSIQVGRSGDLSVTETIQVDFHNLQKHGIFRDIPVHYDYDQKSNRLYRINVRSVTNVLGQRWPYSTSRVGSDLQIKIGDPDRTVSGAQTYAINYTVAGALNGFSDHDELYWNVNGGDWPVSMSHVSATVELPASGVTGSTCYQGSSGATEQCRYSETANGAQYEATRPLAPGEQLTSVLAFNKGLVSAPAPILENKPKVLADFFSTNPVIVALTLLGVLGAVAWVMWMWWRNGRDYEYATAYYRGQDPGPEHIRPFFRPEPIVAGYEPPDGLRPAQLGLILDESADTKDVTATIVDLAVRGYLRIEEQGKHDWKLVKTRSDVDDLLPYELTIFNGLFAGRNEVLLSDLKAHFHGTLDNAETRLYDDAMKRKWFTRNPRSMRILWVLAGVGLVLLGIAVGFGFGWLFGGALLGIPLLVGGLLLALGNGFMPRRTGLGRDVFQKTLGFRLYMTSAEKEQQAFAEKENLFTRYLPYAIVFGCVHRWARAFKDIDTSQAARGWYVGNAPLNALAFSSSLEGFSSQVGTAIAATPASSGSSGFGGGGFSGGGGGGGGGGAW